MRTLPSTYLLISTCVERPKTMKMLLGGYGRGTLGIKLCRELLCQTRRGRNLSVSSSRARCVLNNHCGRVYDFHHAQKLSFSCDTGYREKQRQWLHWGADQNWDKLRWQRHDTI